MSLGFLLVWEIGAGPGAPEPMDEAELTRPGMKEEPPGEKAPAVKAARALSGRCPEK